MPLSPRHPKLSTPSGGTPKPTFAEVNMSRTSLLRAFAHVESGRGRSVHGGIATVAWGSVGVISTTEPLCLYVAMDSSRRLSVDVMVVYFTNLSAVTRVPSSKIFSVVAFSRPLTQCGRVAGPTIFATYSEAYTRAA